MTQAACGRPDVPYENRDAHLRVTRQDDAWDLVAKYCERCPVARLCLADGRNVHGWGLYGGYVLEAGHLAPDRDGEPFHDPETWVPPWDRVDLVALAGGDGITAKQAATAIHGTPDPTDAQLRAARTRLRAEPGLAFRSPTATGDGGNLPGRWHSTDEEPGRPEEQTTTALRGQFREEARQLLLTHYL